MNTPRLNRATWLGPVIAALVLAGCSREADDVRTASTGQPTAVVQGTPSVADTTAKATQEASEATRRAAEQAREAAKNAADQASNKVQDALITTSVNAELAKDPALSAAHIDVETDNGRVALRGTAPDEGARARATQLASGVEGVVSVDNQITVDAKRG